MTLRTPLAAIVWELWHLTRAEVAWKLVLPLGVALAALGLNAAFGPPLKPTNFPPSDAVAAFALVVIVLPHLFGWWSLGKLNGGVPGFPFSLGYTRPVRTSVLVGVPIVYFTVVQTAIYLVSAMVLRAATGYAFPLLPAAAWLAGLSWVGTAGVWSTRDRLLQVLTAMGALGVAFVTVQERLTAVEIEDNFDWPPALWPTLFNWPVTDYAWIALIGLVSAGFTVFMVGVQRRGDGLPTRALTALTGTATLGYWDRLVGLFRLPCPTSSPTLAQVWLDLKSTGFPLLTIAATLALGILMVSAVSQPLDVAFNARPGVSCPTPTGECFAVRAMPPLILTPFSLLAVFVVGRNAFGIRRKQGRAYLSAFDATQAYGTAQVAVLKLVVHSACVVAGLTAIVASFWISMPLLGDAVFVQIWGVPFASRRSLVADAFAALTGYEQLALAVVAAVLVGVWVTACAVLGSLRTRYGRRATIAGCLLLLYGLMFLWLAVAVGVDPATASRLQLDVVYSAMRWIATAAMVFLTAYLGWQSLAEGLLTVRQAWVVVFLSAAFAAAWQTVMRAGGLSPADMSAADAAWMLWPALLPLTVSVLAPWSYSRIRHT
jgi:hypothetical protein